MLSFRNTKQTSKNEAETTFKEVTGKNHQKLEAEWKTYQMLLINLASNIALPEAASIRFSYTIFDKVVTINKN